MHQIQSRHFLLGFRFFAQVRALWAEIRDFLRSSCAARDVIDSIVQGSVDAERVDATQLDVRVPETLLRQCEQEIQRVSDEFIEEFIFKTR